MTQTVKESRRLRNLTFSHFVALFVVAGVPGNLLFSGILKHGPAKNIDFPYFYVAAKCWAAGHSPYQASVYNAAYKTVFGSWPNYPFPAYLPTLMLLTLPMSHFDWRTAARLFAVLNLGAGIVLFWACWRLVSESVKRALRPSEWIWVALASTIGGAAGSIMTGQTSLIVTAACAVAIVGCRLGRTWLVVSGAVVASMKPQLSGPLLLFIFFFEPRQRRAVYMAIGVIAAVCLYAAMVDDDFISNYFNSIRGTGAVHDPNQGMGMVSLLLLLGVRLQAADLLGLVALVALLGFVAWSLGGSAQPFTERPLALILVSLSTGLLVPIHGYDFCFYAVGISAIAALPRLQQWILFLPVLFLWRPSLPGLFHVGISGSYVATIAWSILLLSVIVIASEKVRSSAGIIPSRSRRKELTANAH